MNILRVLFFCFLSALWGGNTGLASAKPYIFTGAEGGNGTISCYLSKVGSRKFFCKDECKDEDILIKTDDVTAQSGRYSTNYRDGSSGQGILSVTITGLTKSDAGQYRCGLGATLVPDSYTDFEVRVSDALDGNSGFIRTDTEGGEVTLGCSNTVYGTMKFFCKDECKKEEDVLIETDGNRAQSGRYSLEYKEGSTFGLSVTITQVTKSDTGHYRCGYGRALSPDSHSGLQIIVIGAPTTLRPFSTSVPSATTPSMTPSISSGISETTNQCTGFLFPLVVCVIAVVVLLAVVLLLLYKLKTKRNSDGRDMEFVTNENRSPVSTLEDNVYQNFDPASKN